MPDSRKPGKTRHLLLLVLRIGVVVFGLVWMILWLAGGQRWSNLIDIFRQMNIAIFAVVLVFFVTGQVVIALRWWLLLRSQSIFIRFWIAVRLFFLGWFYNNCMPGSVGGDLIRAWYVTKHTEKRFAAALSVFVDRVIGLFSTLLIAIFFYSLFLRDRQNAIKFAGIDNLLGFLSRSKGTILVICLAVIAVPCVLWLFDSTRAMLKKAFSTICMHVRKLLTELKDAAVIYLTSPMTILAVLALTVFVQMITITLFWLLGKEFNITVSIKYYYVFFALTWVFGSVPVSIGGAVVVEGMLMVLFIKIAGVAENAALALALCQRFVWILASLPGAVIHLTGAHLPAAQGPIDAAKSEDFFVDSGRTID